MKYRHVPEVVEEPFDPKGGYPPPISVVICAKNEAENLKRNLPYILKQDYPDQFWEIIVVNDGSTDETAEVLAGFKKQFKQLRIITLPADMKRDLPGKKFALNWGVRKAAGQYILLTDADCRPQSNQWLAGFAQRKLATGRNIFLGYGAYEHHSGLLNKMIRWDTLQTCSQYVGMFLAGIPYMGVGRNMMYRKTLYQKAFEDELFLQMYCSVLSGDDDLIINKISTGQNSELCLHPSTFTVSIPKKSFKEFFIQKTRHISAGSLYSKRIKTILGLTSLSQGMFWLLWLILLILFPIRLTTEGWTVWTITLGLLVLVGGVKIYLYWKNTRKWFYLLDGRDLFRFYPLNEICLSLFQLILTPFIWIKNKRQWKS